MRRWAVVAGLMGGLAACGPDGAGPSPPPVPFSNPPEMVSRDGVLAGTLTIEPAALEVGGESVTFLGLYNGLYMPPVLRVRPGDVVRLKLRNAALLPSNVHYHGLQVSPLGAGDNVFLTIEPGITFQYDMPIPADHPQGLFWYHPHFHPLVNTEIAGGLSGGLIVGDILAPFPQLAGIPERVMLLKDLKTEDGQPVLDPDPSGPTTRTINGLYQPRIEMQPGQLEFWRIGNIGANIYYQISLSGQPFYVIAQDGNLQNQILQMQTLLLPPGKRLELLIYGPDRPGSYPLQAAAFDTGPDGDQYPAQLLATVSSAGPTAPLILLPSTLPTVPDLRQRRIDRRRTIVFADTANPNEFIIDGKPYNHHCVDTVVTLGEVEEWTIQNTAAEAHVFHIHQLDFQVTAINGIEQPFTGYQDTVNLLPAADDGTPSSVTAIMPFDNPVIVGEFVYHCHIVQHADQGMMANIVVVDPAEPPGGHIPLCDGTHL
jgi:FtsP/CotA-like multicopper oxidase with cupredoxin domain